MEWNEILDKIRLKSRAAAMRGPDKIPYTAVDGVFDDRSADISWWTNGFWAGQLWQLYGAFGDEIFCTVARRIEEKLDRSLMSAQGMDHDSGFKWLLTAGADFLLTQNAASKNRFLLAANDLAGRSNPAGNFIRAWNDGGDGSMAGIAIVDCMMNLPLLYRASEMTHDPRFAHIAERHADTAARAFVREDGSVCHIVEFDPNTGVRKCSRGGQGFGHGSAWTRGQAWAIYGFTLSFLHTKKESYLETAERVAAYFLTHIPESGLIPVDFCQPAQPAYEDTSAAAIAACGLLELAKASEKAQYGSAAERLLRTIAEKRCDLDERADHILENCSAAYHEPVHGYPLIYGDYFFTEAVCKLTGKETFLW